MMDNDPLRPNDDVYKSFYERGYATWMALQKQASRDHRLPPSCLQVDGLFPQHPYLPVGLDVEESGLLTATSTWALAEGLCEMPSFKQRFQMNLCNGEPTAVLVTSASTRDFSRWFGTEGDHLAVLTLAWAYALTARWAEIVSRAAPPEYTDSRAAWVGDEGQPLEDSAKTIVELGTISSEATRWWAAVLAPGEGWRASIPHARYRLLSPWAVTFESRPPIALAATSRPPSSSSEPPPSFETAVQYIEEYVALHSASEQNRAALAAALLLPLANFDRRKVLLPFPRIGRGQASSAPSKCPIWGPDQRQLDKLLTLSCNAWGVKSILGSVFYELAIPSNVCGAWLQGTFAALRSNNAQNLYVLACMFFMRSPRLSFLWLGAIITGAHRPFIQNPHGLLGLNRIDLHEAAWTETCLSFIQEPISHQRSTSSITRADECRLEFLSQGLSRDMPPPIYPYPPPGATAIEDLNLDTRLHVHAKCKGDHRLRFLNISWNCVGGHVKIQDAGTLRVSPRLPTFFSPLDQIVDYSHMCRDRDLSIMVTCNIFTWLRGVDGFPVAEQSIYQHECFYDGSDDESVSPEGDGGSTVGLNIAVNIGLWTSKSLTTRCNSL